MENVITGIKDPNKMVNNISIDEKKELKKQMEKDEIDKNTPYNFKDYMCVFENAGYEIPPEYFGMLYQWSTDFDYRENLCKNSTRTSAEGGMYIKRDDWIDPRGESVCGIFDVDGTRLTVDDEGKDKRQFPSKSLCDLYNTPKPDPKNANRKIITKVMPADVINPVLDYDKKQPIEYIGMDKESIEMKENIMLSMVWVIVFVYLFYIFKFQINRPYEIYDIGKKLFLNKMMIAIFCLFIYVYLFCPFGICYHELLTPLYRKRPEYETHRILCQNLKKFRGKRTSEITNVCDSLLNYGGSSVVNTCNVILNAINSKTGRNIYNKTYSQLRGCAGCVILNECIERQSNHIINIFQENDGSYYKKCILCDERFCNDIGCYPGKNAYYDDLCPNNTIIEHDIESIEYETDKTKMKCKYCNQECYVTL